MEAEIRLAAKSDVQDHLRIYAPFVTDTIVSFEEEVPSDSEFWSRIEKTLEKSPWMVCEIDGQIAGYGYAGDHRGRSAYRWNRELSVYVDENFRRRGVAKALYISIVNILKLQGYTNLLAGITLPNPVSVAFHEDFGFKKIGEYHNVGYKFGQWRDTGWWEMPLDDHSSEPGRIKPLEEVRSTPEWDLAIQEGLKHIKE